MINMHTEHTHIRSNGCVRETNIRIWKYVFSLCVDSINIWPLTSSFQPTAFHNGLALFRSIKIVWSAKAYTSEDDCLDIFDSAFAMVHEWIIFDCSYDFEMSFNRRLDGSPFDVLSHSLDMQRHVPPNANAIHKSHFYCNPFSFEHMHHQLSNQNLLASCRTETLWAYV